MFSEKPACARKLARLYAKRTRNEYALSPRTSQEGKQNLTHVGKLLQTAPNTHKGFLHRLLASLQFARKERPCRFCWYCDGMSYSTGLFGPLCGGIRRGVFGVLPSGHFEQAGSGVPDFFLHSSLAHLFVLFYGNRRKQQGEKPDFYTLRSKVIDCFKPKNLLYFYLFEPVAIG